MIKIKDTNASFMCVTEGSGKVQILLNDVNDLGIVIENVRNKVEDAAMFKMEVWGWGIKLNFYGQVEFDEMYEKYKLLLE